MAEEPIPVRKSDQVASATYDADEQVMTVTFQNDAVYRYDGVEQSTADAMATVPWNSIKAGLFSYTKVS